MYALVITYTFDADVPVFLFNTEEDACRKLREDFENEKEIQFQNDCERAIRMVIDEDDTYAFMDFAGSDRIEWAVTHVTDCR